jgi:polyisoprenoid-binding protein YceI
VFGFSASTEVNREDWGLTWNMALESGGVMVGKKIKIEIEGEAIRQD